MSGPRSGFHRDPSFVSSSNFSRFSCSRSRRVPEASSTNNKNCVPLITPSLFLYIYIFLMPSSFLPQYPPFSSPSFGSVVAMTTAALHHSSAGDLGSCSCRERERGGGGREREHLSRLYITRQALMQSEANEDLTSLSARTGNSPVSFVFSFLFFWLFRHFLNLFFAVAMDLVRLGSELPSLSCHLCALLSPQ